MAEYIDKDRAIEIVSKNGRSKYCVHLLTELPAADVQPVKRGRWEQIGEQSSKCTACGGVLKSNGIDKTGKALIFNAVYHYCPYCGANMRGDT